MERSSAARYGTVIFWILAGIMHFVIPRQYEGIVPPRIARWKKECVVVSGLAEIAGHSTFTGIVEELVSRSSLIIALYWERRETTCETHAHRELVDAIAKRDASAASDLMKKHLVDLLSGLDLTLGEKSPRRLADILSP